MPPVRSNNLSEGKQTILNTAIFTATVAAAKAKCAGNAALLRSIDRAVTEIEKAKYWSFADGILMIISTTSGERYVIGDDHTCPAQSKTCKHLVARRLMQRYYEALAAADAKPQAAPVAEDLAALIASVEKAWKVARPFSAISWPLHQIFGVTELAALNVEQLQQVYGAITRHAAPVR